MSDSYTCARCGEAFYKGQTDEEALAETRQFFGNIRPEECVVICEDCFQLMHPDQHPHLVEEAVAETLRAREVTS